MKNPNIKVWMWQRLWKVAGDDEVYSRNGVQGAQDKSECLSCQ